MMNEIELLKLTEAQILSWTEEKNGINRVVMPKDKWKHRPYRRSIADPTYECGRCGATVKTNRPESGCTAPPPLNKSLAEYAFELAEEVWGKCWIEKFGGTYHRYCEFFTKLYEIEVSELTIIKAALIAKRRSLKDEL